MALEADVAEWQVGRQAVVHRLLACIMAPCHGGVEVYLFAYNRLVWEYNVQGGAVRQCNLMLSVQSVLVVVVL